MDDNGQRAEMAELRRRVFGPGADPADPAALERLRELEGRDAAADPERVEPVDASDGDAGKAEPATAPRRRTRRPPRIRPRLAASWAASLLVAAVAGAGATAWWLGDERGTVAVLTLEPPPVPDNAT